MNGQPKQLLKFRGETLLRRAAETVVRSNFEKAVAVFGAGRENLSAEIDDLPIRTTMNENAGIGLSSSIKAGLSALSEENLDAVIIMLCDQPLITSETLQSLCDVFFETGKPIVACEYENTVGVPALFAREVFAELTDLRGDEGAKKIIGKYGEKAALVRAPEGGLDIDTIEDYRKLKQ